MNANLKVGLIIGGVILSFAAGWFAAQIQHVNSVSPRVVWVDQWVDDLALLAFHGTDIRLKTPEQTQSFALSGLNTDSHTVALLYDTLPPDLRKRVQFWMPAARLIATTQQDPGVLKDRRNLLDFVDCAKSVQLHGGTVRACYQARQHPKSSH